MQRLQKRRQRSHPSGRVTGAQRRIPRAPRTLLKRQKSTPKVSRGRTHRIQIRLVSMPTKKNLEASKTSGSSPTLVPSANELEFITQEQVAAKLHQTVDWVESKCRRRCPNPIPFHNVGNHRLFVWREVFEWVVNSPKVIHSRHRRRTKEEIAAVQKAKAEKRAA